MTDMTRSLAVALLVALGLSAAAPVRADTFRLPQDGEPAFEVDAPLSWSATYDRYGNLHFLAADRSSSFQVSMIGDPGVARTSAAAVAAQIYKSAGARPYERTEPGSIAGVNGEAFVGVLPINGIDLDLRVVLVRLDESHFACLSVLRRRGLTAEQSQALDHMLARVRFKGRP